MKLHGIAFILVVIGSLNMGLTALGTYVDNNWNVLKYLLGSVPGIENLVYLFIGISALVLLLSHKKNCRACNP